MRFNIWNISLFYTNWAFVLHCLHFSGIIPSTRLIANLVAIVGTAVVVYNSIKHSTTPIVANVLHLLPVIAFQYKKTRNPIMEKKTFALSAIAYLFYITFVRGINLFDLYSDTEKYRFDKPSP